MSGLTLTALDSPGQFCDGLEKEKNGRKRPRLEYSMESLTLEALKANFHLPLQHVADKFGICVTFFKKICRAHGIMRWPHRQVTKMLKIKERQTKTPKKPTLKEIETLVKRGNTSQVQLDTGPWGIPIQKKDTSSVTSVPLALQPLGTCAPATVGWSTCVTDCQPSPKPRVPAPKGGVARPVPMREPVPMNPIRAPSLVPGNPAMPGLIRLASSKSPSTADSLPIHTHSKVASTRVTRLPAPPPVLRDPVPMNPNWAPSLVPGNPPMPGLIPLTSSKLSSRADSLPIHTHSKVASMRVTRLPEPPPLVRITDRPIAKGSITCAECGGAPDVEHRCTHCPCSYFCGPKCEARHNECQKHQAPHRQPAEQHNEVTCGICLGDVRQPIVLSCRHSFCTSCLEEYERVATPRARCPFCRSSNLSPSRITLSLMEDVALHMRRANCHSHQSPERQDEIQNAMGKVDTLLLISPKAGYGRFIKAELHVYTGDFKAAIYCMKELLQDRGQTSNLDESDDEWDELNTVFAPGSLKEKVWYCKQYIFLAQCYMAIQEFQQAVMTYRQAYFHCDQTMVKDQQVVLSGLATCFKGLGQYQLAAQIGAVQDNKSVEGSMVTQAPIPVLDPPISTARA